MVLLSTSFRPAKQWMWIFNLMSAGSFEEETAERKTPLQSVEEGYYLNPPVS